MKKLIVALLFIFAGSLFFADTSEKLTVLRDFAYIHDATSAEVYEFYKTAVSEIQNNLDENHIDESLINLAQAEFYVGKVYLAEGKQKIAVAHFEGVERLADQSLAIKESVPALLLKAKAIFMQCQLKSFFYTVLHRGEFYALLDSIMERDSRNIAALYLKGASYIYFPIFFADQEKGRIILQEGLIFIPANDIENFFLFNSSIGDSFARNKKSEKAEVYYEKARQFFPLERK